MPPATNKARGQVLINDSHQMPQARTACTTRNTQGHQNRCQATRAAIQMKVRAPGSEHSPCWLWNSCCPGERVRARRRTQPLPATKQLLSGWTCARPEGTKLLSATRSRRADRRVRAPQRRPAQQHQHNALSKHTREQEASGPRLRARNTTHRATTPVHRSQVAQDTAQATQHGESTHRCKGVKRPRTPHTQHMTPSEHTGEQEPGDPGHCTSNRRREVCTLVNRS